MQVLIQAAALVLAASAFVIGQECQPDDPVCRQIGQPVCEPPLDTFGKAQCGIFCEYCFYNETATTTTANTQEPNTSPSTPTSGSTEICGEDDPICREVGSAICGPEYYDFAKRKCGVYCEYCFDTGAENTTTQPLSTTIDTFSSTITELTTTTTKPSTTTAAETPSTETTPKRTSKLTTMLLPSTSAPLSTEPSKPKPSTIPTTVETNTKATTIQITTDMPTMTPTTTLNPTPGHWLFNDCNDTAEVVFVLDSSSSVGEENFKKMLEFTQNMTERLKAEYQRLNLSVITFNNEAKVSVRFNESTDLASVLTAEGNIPYSHGGTQTHKAIELMFKSFSHNVKNPKISIVITDGASFEPDQTRKAAKDAKDNGVAIFVIGVGDDVNTHETKDISSDPDSRFLYQLNNFSGLSTIVQLFHSRDCRVITTLPTTVSTEKTTTTEPPTTITVEPITIQTVTEEPKTVQTVTEVPQTVPVATDILPTESPETPPKPVSGKLPTLIPGKDNSSQTPSAIPPFQTPSIVSPVTGQSPSLKPIETGPTQGTVSGQTAVVVPVETKSTETPITVTPVIVPVDTKQTDSPITVTDIPITVKVQSTLATELPITATEPPKSPVTETVSTSKQVEITKPATQSLTTITSPQETQMSTKQQTTQQPQSTNTTEKQTTQQPQQTTTTTTEKQTTQQPQPTTNIIKQTTLQPNPTTTAEKQTTQQPQPTTTTKIQTSQQPQSTTTTVQQTTPQPQSTTTTEMQTTPQPQPTTTTKEETTPQKQPTRTTEKQITPKPQPTTTTEKQTATQPQPTTTMEKQTTPQPQRTTTKGNQTTTRPQPTTTTEKQTTPKPEPTTTTVKQTTPQAQPTTAKEMKSTPQSQPTTTAEKQTTQQPQPTTTTEKQMSAKPQLTNTTVKQTTPQAQPTTTKEIRSTQQPQPTTTTEMKSTPQLIQTTTTEMRSTPKPMTATTVKQTTPEPQPTTTTVNQTTPQPQPATTTETQTTPQPQPTTTTKMQTTAQPQPTTTTEMKSTPQPQPTTTTEKQTTPQPQPTTTTEKQTTPQPQPTTTMEKQTTTQPQPTTAKVKQTTPQPQSTTTMKKQTTPQPQPTTTTEKQTTPQPQSTNTTEKQTTPQPQQTTTTKMQTSPQPQQTTTTEKQTTPQPQPSTTMEKQTTQQPQPTTTAENQTTPQPQPTTTETQTPSGSPEATKSPSVTSTQQLPTTTATCIAKVADVVFVVDSSGSIGSQNFQKVKQFIKEVIMTFDVGLDRTRVALIEYSTHAHIEFKLNEKTNHTELINAVNNVTYSGGGTATSDALNLMRTEGFDRERPDAPDIVVVITDGLSKYPAITRTQANLAKSEGITMFSIGIGNLTDQNELLAIASDKRFLFQVGDFETLLTIDSVVAHMACGVVLPEQHYTRVSTTPSTTPSGCVDLSPDCGSYPRDSCTDFEPYARKNCAKTCGYCPGIPLVEPECKDEEENCEQYGTSMCYNPPEYDWVNSHCRQFCGFCGNKTELYVTTKPTTTQVMTTASATCEDKFGSCSSYNADLCTNPTYDAWARANCPKYCGFCYNYKYVTSTVVNQIQCPSWQIPEQCTLEYTAGQCCPFPKCTDGLRLTIRRHL